MGRVESPLRGDQNRAAGYQTGFTTESTEIAEGDIDRIYRMDGMGAGTGAYCEWDACPPVAGRTRMGSPT